MVFTDMSTLVRRFWIVTVATVLTMAATASLGRWQLQRADQKLALQAEMDARAALPVWSETDLLQTPAPRTAWHRPVRLQGEWVPHASVFLDNRQMDGRPGFFLLTPLRLAGSDRSVLVQRGWAPRDFIDRSRTPDVPTPAGEVTLEGRLAPPPAKLYELGESAPGPIRQNIELAAMGSEFKLDLLDASVLQTSDVEDGLLRQWPRVETGVDKHHGYAFQWFALCTLAAVLYLWFQLISPRRKRKVHGPDA
ncbi:MAG: surfeit locus 1 family protein [Hydrogenophaga sp.]|jgi:surfeit locus 1 family protein